MTRATAASLAAMRRRLDEPPPENVPGQLAVEVPVAEEKPPKVCEYGNPRCGAVPVRFYPAGWFCDAHPAGRPTHRRTAP
ncbi:aromatic ring-opening dioxygenase LigA [Streptomyces sp. MBT53]|uniref:aromatic ring-opening dioxygenase LigA n=1 Tax=Streptomyces sp. MBT53 TaxID=1488384 RepID=UPI0019123EBC|nr:aromatic ring-opening dioxygenase LigA [Streptomyces sp. MBT53]MBK6018535.1 aromatic ring-opening dioxygenase LigA [Streptomyces sp. MBT53]